VPAAENADFNPKNNVLDQKVSAVV